MRRWNHTGNVPPTVVIEITPEGTRQMGDGCCEPQCYEQAEGSPTPPILLAKRELKRTISA
jgi:hypothetical protein